jgi:imidazolonepropionase-like amidohydrolase
MSGIGTLLILSLSCGQEGAVAYRVGKIVPVTAAPIDDGLIVVSGGKIAAMGPAAQTSAPEGASIVDLSSRWAVPGFIDLHCHIGGGRTGDINDMVLPTNPGLGTRAAVDPDAQELKDAVAGGVTTVLFIPGSGTNMGGFGTLMHTAGGRTIESLVLRYPGAVKVAQAHNPERGAGDLGASRTGMWWNLRRTLDRGRDYDRRWRDYESGLSRLKPELDPELDLLRGLFQKKYPVIVHTADARDVMGTVRMFHDEYELWLIVTHGEFGAWKVAHEAGKRGVPCNIGPRIFDFLTPRYDNYENKILGIPSAYYEAGVKRLSLCTDSPVIPQEELQLQGSLAARLGLPRQVALAALTIEPARAVGIDDRAGSLEVGKQADIVFWTGDPLDVRHGVERVLIDGRTVYDATKEARRRF